jgi:hypothetical protein
MFSLQQWGTQKKRNGATRKKWAEGKKWWRMTSNKIMSRWTAMDGMARRAKRKARKGKASHKGPDRSGEVGAGIIRPSHDALSSRTDGGGFGLLFFIATAAMVESTAFREELWRKKVASFSSGMHCGCSCVCSPAAPIILP